MEHPVTHQREVDLELGKHWIDVLGMLQQKTQGNLSTQEAKILEGFLADLRMQFVSLANSSTPKASRTYSRSGYRRRLRARPKQMVTLGFGHSTF